MKDEPKEVIRRLSAVVRKDAYDKDKIGTLDTMLSRIFDELYIYGHLKDKIKGVSIKDVKYNDSEYFAIGFDIVK